MTTMKSLLTGLSILPSLAVGFDLNTGGPDWGLTSNSLDKYTSHYCRIAYSAPIDCSDTLLSLVASPDPNYIPTATDLDNTCTPTCQTSLENYVRNVEEACSSPWDWALVSTAALCTDCRLLQTPVDNIGRIFQYTLESVCALDKNYDYCLFHPEREGPDFDCSDTCSIAYYNTARAHPVSKLLFKHHWLIQQSRYWKLDFENGYKRAQECEQQK